MRLCVPSGIEPVWCRREADALHRGIDLSTGADIRSVLNLEKFYAIVNLAGESRVDVVEKNSIEYEWINARLPEWISIFMGRECKLIHVSSQACYGEPVNEYGRQKQYAEREAIKNGAVVVRPSFILGVRPLPHVGRENPLEAMFDWVDRGNNGYMPQAWDRWFSPCFAREAAHAIWEAVLNGNLGEVINVGIPERMSRADIAEVVGCAVEKRTHASFRGIAERPTDTTYEDGVHQASFNENLNACRYQRKLDHAIELALFCGMQLDASLDKLAQGFGPLHNEVTADFNASKPVTDQELLDWYRKTETYIWELTAYHNDPGFNYSGMCEGLITRLKGEGMKRILVLGDGIGTFSIKANEAGLDPTYHDLEGSCTAEFAMFRFWRQGLAMPAYLTSTFNPGAIGASDLVCGFDAVVSLDFLEHVTNVEAWARAAYAALRPGGLLVAQNAFGMGSGPNGAMPMHLEVNDRFEKDWDPLLFSLGFVQESSNWYRKP